MKDVKVLLNALLEINKITNDPRILRIITKALLGYLK